MPENDLIQVMQDKRATALLEMSKVINGVGELFSEAAKEPSESSSEPFRVDASQDFVALLGLIENTRPEHSSSSSDADMDTTTICRIS